MIGNKSVQTILRQILNAFYIHFRIQKIHTRFQKVHSQFILRLIQEYINFILMNNFLQVRNHELRDVLITLRSLCPKYLIDIDQK